MKKQRERNYGNTRKLESNKKMAFYIKFLHINDYFKWKELNSPIKRQSGMTDKKKTKFNCRLPTRDSFQL